MLAIRFIVKLRKCLSKNHLMMVNAFVTSRTLNWIIVTVYTVAYPSEKWTSCSVFRLCAARLVSGIRSDHKTPVMKDFYSLPIGARIDFKILLLTFKILNDLPLYYLSWLLLNYQPARLLRSFKRLVLQVPSVNTVAYGHPLYASKIQSSLPNHIKNSESVSTFKQRLKTFLFKNN